MVGEFVEIEGDLVAISKTNETERRLDL